MANIPQKVADRLVAGIKKFQPILTAAQSREANEADTVKIITDMLSEIFGYDIYRSHFRKSRSRNFLRFGYKN